MMSEEQNHKKEIIMAVFSNRATLSYSGITTDSNVVTGEIVEVLSGVKEAVLDTYGAGETVTYVISIVNSGAVPYTDLSVSDDLGSYTLAGTTRTPLTYNEGSLRYFVNGGLQASPTPLAGPPLVINGINVPAAGNVILIYSATVNGEALLSPGSTILNTATVSGNGITPFALSETINAREGVLLSIEKALSPAVISENGEITYTFTIRNSGSVAAISTDNVTLSDTFSPILQDITVTLDGQVLSEGADYTYDQGSGAFSTAPGRITVPAAVFTVDPITNEETVTPGVTVLTVRGRV